jgi:hypothetical protein
MFGFETMDQIGMEPIRLVRAALDKRTAINDLITVLKSRRLRHTACCKK